MGFYAESTDRPHFSRVASEDVEPGEMVVEDGSDGYRLANGADDADWDGVADKIRVGDHIAGDADTTDGGLVYQSSENDRVPAVRPAENDLIKVRTIKDNGTDPAPSINDGDTVIVPDASLAASAAEFEGRIVEDGYSDNSGDTHDTTNGLLVGYAERDSASGFDEVVRVSVQHTEH